MELIIDMRGKMSNFALQIIFFLAFFIGASGCNKLVDVAPPITSNTAASVYMSDATSISVLTGLYTKMSIGSVSTAGLVTSLSLFSGLSADEFKLYSGVTSLSLNAYYKNSLTGGTTGIGSEYWSILFQYVFICNSALEGLGNSSQLTSTVKNQLMGEAKFLRAFFYFYLVNLYGDLPMPLSSNYKTNATLPRIPIAQIYQQIVADLKSAQTLLNLNYLDGALLNTTTERVRPNYSAATALLSRAYLFASDYINSEAQATQIISNSSLYNLSTLDKVFLKASNGNSEAIWQLQPVNSGWNTEEARVFIVPSSGPNTAGNVGVLLSDSLLKNFEIGDKRRTNWVGSITIGGTIYNFPNKYKINTQNAAVSEYSTLLRLGEQYLIRSEARVRQGNLTGAVADLNIIRNRAGLGNYTGNLDENSLLAAILHEKQIELFSEMGHRWIDLKRTGSVDATLGAPGNACAVKGGQWNTSKQLYPLPLSDLQNNPNLVQNTNY